MMLRFRHERFRDSVPLRGNKVYNRSLDNLLGPSDLKENEMRARGNMRGVVKDLSLRLGSMDSESSLVE
jgi:hypothetical protein